MKKHSPEEIADAYIERYEKMYVTDKDNVIQKQDLNFWAFEKFQELTHDHPNEAWSLILYILEKTNNEYVLSNLAAGELEDLIQYHGETFIEKIETKARKEPRFRELLCGVWETSNKEIWARVLEARNESL